MQQTERLAEFSSTSANYDLYFSGMFLFLIQSLYDTQPICSRIHA
jgi:hypothetical protein